MKIPSSYRDINRAVCAFNYGESFNQFRGRVRRKARTQNARDDEFPSSRRQETFKGVRNGPIVSLAPYAP